MPKSIIGNFQSIRPTTGYILILPEIYIMYSNNVFPFCRMNPSNGADSNHAYTSVINIRSYEFIFCFL